MQIAIETVNINLNQGPSSVTRAFVEALLRTPDAPAKTSEQEELDASTTTNLTTPPNIGEYWLGQGGIYVGIARGRDSERDYHLILCKEDPKQDFTWQVALDHARTVSADGHSDFTLPTRFESALLYANLQDEFDTNHWYWTSTQVSESAAWNQLFNDGFQRYNNYKDYERRCRFVRRLVL